MAADEFGAVNGSPRVWLRAEAAAVLVAASAGYFGLGGNGWLFALLFFAPDLSFLGYLAGRKAGAVVYNIAHSYVLSAVLGALGLALQNPLLQHLALIHAAHVGFDRSLGYGLKYPSDFSHTHLGRIGRDAKVPRKAAAR